MGAFDSVRPILRKALGREHTAFGERSYSQEGEDRILQRLFDTRPGGSSKPGFYVDVGAHHPYRFSNTFAFYEMGWRGINVDAMPGSMRPFAAFRPRDINVEAAISDKPETLTYYVFNEPALNGFNDRLSSDRDGKNGYRIVERRTLQTRTLSSLLSEFLPKNQEIDFISVDVEGLDLKVLRSNDWTLYRPVYILAEDISAENLKAAMECDIARYLKEQDYEICSKTVTTIFFFDKRRQQG